MSLRLTGRIYDFFIRHKFNSVGNCVYFGKISFLKGAKNIKIGSHVSFGKYLYLTAWSKDSLKQKNELENNPEICIGNHCSIGAYNHITATNRIVIGDGFLSGKWVTISDNSHGNYDINNSMDIAQWQNEIPIKRAVVSKGPVIIGKNVWVGDKVTILSGVSIGEGAVIGANSVVTKNIPPYCVVGGNPARVLKQIKSVCQ